MNGKIIKISEKEEKEGGLGFRYLDITTRVWHPSGIVDPEITKKFYDELDKLHIGQVELVQEHRRKV